MLPQTRRARDAMVACGFRWPEDFHVRTLPDDRGNYGSAQVTVYGDAEKRLSGMVRVLAATGDLDVTVWKHDYGEGDFIWIESGSGKLAEIDVRKEGGDDSRDSGS